MCHIVDGYALKTLLCILGAVQKLVESDTPRPLSLFAFSLFSRLDLELKCYNGYVLSTKRAEMENEKDPFRVGSFFAKIHVN